MHESVPLRAALRIERNLVIMCHLSGNRCIIDNLLAEPNSTKGGFPNFVICPVQLK
jgi:hypothetical protein